MHVWVSGPTKTPTAVGVRSQQDGEGRIHCLLCTPTERNHIVSSQVFWVTFSITAVVVVVIVIVDSIAAIVVVIIVIVDIIDAIVVVIICIVSVFCLGFSS
ncbi:hypothetical protein TNCV_3125651 [Trichonephila clavipes]|nr:hypothetical protein TNCV_3125651 [Trichonephila clavipes]